MTDFPTVAQLQMQSFCTGRLAGGRLAIEEVTAFATRVREREPRLTDKASMVLFALSRIASPIIVKELPLKPTVLWVVLRALYDLGLVEVAGERWNAVVFLTEAGNVSVAEASQ
jgi:hypothetical protein